jgi:hypothetical protein
MNSSNEEIAYTYQQILLRQNAFQTFEKTLSLAKEKQLEDIRGCKINCVKG